MRALSIEECDLVSGGDIEEIIIYGQAPPSSDPNAIAAFMEAYNNNYARYIYYYDTGGYYTGGYYYEANYGLTDIPDEHPPYREWRTAAGTDIVLNKPEPDTVLPSGDNLVSLIQFVDNTGLDEIVVSGGKETSGHSPNSFHYTNRAVDIAGPNAGNAGLTDAIVLAAARESGYTHVVFETGDPNDTDDDHWHLQMGDGNGLDHLHTVWASTIQVDDDEH